MPDSSPLELALLIGLQGAGKSTFYRARFAVTHVLVSKDLFPNNRDKSRRQRQLVSEALQAGRSVVVDNTNAAVEERADLVSIGRAFGATVTGYFFVPDVRGSLARNRNREGKARVPDVAVFATSKRLQSPTFAEGFDALFDVRLEGDTFSLQERPREEQR
ncbi:ATP-binding protein [Deinococcus yavapaiensis]|uniref:Putative kinase n=1 Tax=Deinococcus yavapaiensis KR-236 TaxID=694435 RepID=A0A318SIC1_9DEIO|nr:ATP-binding protein [Deinococcus yavapaiensis]PYE53807.1 putative kinase [Deinococcus yavapaiensis KR-236]